MELIEETWTVHEYEHRLYIDVTWGVSVEMRHVTELPPPNGAESERVWARTMLAAQAPEMARILLKFADDERLTGIERSVIQGTLRAAGIAS